MRFSKFNQVNTLKLSAQKTTEACDWLIGTHISDKWRPYAFGLIDIFACY